MAATHAVGATARSQQERLAVAQIPHNLQASSAASAKSRTLAPVRLGQSTQAPASGLRVGSVFENGAPFNTSMTFCSIHSLSWRKGSKVRFGLPFVFQSSWKQAASASSCSSGWSLASSKAWPHADLVVGESLDDLRGEFGQLDSLRDVAGRLARSRRNLLDRVFRHLQIE